jgi:lysophospholipase L1-like esterase
MTDSKNLTILFQGDSITDCGRSREAIPTWNGVGLGTGYAALVAARLLCERPSDGLNFYNRGVSGNRVVDLYARWKIDALNLKPDVISILVGVNDTWHEFGSSNGVEVPRYEQFYRMLMEWTMRELPEVGVIILEPFVMPFGAATDAWVPEIDQRRAVARKIADEFKTEFIPAQSIFDKAIESAPPQHWLNDGVHPLPAGHQLLADAWLEAFARLGK